MVNKQLIRKLVLKLENILDKSIISVEYPRQGADGFVFYVSTVGNESYAVKVGVHILNDKITLNTISESGIDIPAPRTITYFELENKQILVMSKLDGVSYRAIRKEFKQNFLGSIIENLKVLHTIKSSKAGLPYRKEHESINWKEFLLNKYLGNDPWFNWQEICQRDEVNSELIKKSLNYFIRRIESTDLDIGDNSLIHTDINQGNLLVNITERKVSGIVDWSEAMYGDPLFDFARVRMNIWHNFKPEAENIYNKLLNFDSEEVQREKLYYDIHVLDYINWFSEAGDSKRLKQHQDYLANLLGL